MQVTVTVALCLLVEVFQMVFFSASAHFQVLVKRSEELRLFLRYPGEEEETANKKPRDSFF